MGRWEDFGFAKSDLSIGSFERTCLTKAVSCIKLLSKLGTYKVPFKQNIFL